MNDGTCNTCGAPIHWVGTLQLWYHDLPNDTLRCPSQTIEPAEQVADLILAGEAGTIFGIPFAAREV